MHAPAVGPKLEQQLQVEQAAGVGWGGVGGCQGRKRLVARAGNAQPTRVVARLGLRLSARDG